MGIPLSFSRLDKYLQCPKAFYLTNIEKIPELAFQENDATRRGKVIHKNLEDFINWRNDASMAEPIMSSTAGTATPIINRLFSKYEKTGSLYAERQFAISNEDEISKCGWFDSNDLIMYRGIFDFLILAGDEAIVLDFKSGKRRSYSKTPLGQLNLAAMMLYHLYPNIQTVTAGYVFVDHPEMNEIYGEKVAAIDKVQFTRDELPEMDKVFREAYDAVQSETEWKPQKNQYCRWCGIREDCEFG